MEINLIPIILTVLIIVMIKQVIDIKNILGNMDSVCGKMIARCDKIIKTIDSMKTQKPKSKKKDK
jgi:hypothetical protein